MRHLHKEPREDALLDVGEVVRALEVVSVRHVVVQTAQNALQLVPHVQCRRDRSVVDVIVVAPLRPRLRRHLHKRVVQVQKRDVIAVRVHELALRLVRKPRALARTKERGRDGEHGRDRQHFRNTSILLRTQKGFR